MCCELQTYPKHPRLNVSTEMFLNAKCKGLKRALDASWLHMACCHSRRAVEPAGACSPRAGLALFLLVLSFHSLQPETAVVLDHIFPVRGLTVLIDIFGLPGRSLQGQKGTHRKSIRPHITSLSGVTDVSGARWDLSQKPAGSWSPVWQSRVIQLSSHHSIKRGATSGPTI